jgi:single-strand DNA-binding protein
MANRRLPMLNKILIIGNLTNDPELRFTQSGIAVLNFRIASNRRFRDSAGEWKEDVCYVGVVAWQKLAENCAEFLRKGSAVFVEGEIQSRSWEKEDGSRRSVVEIHAQRVQFLDRREAVAGSEESQDFNAQNNETKEGLNETEREAEGI